MNTYALVEVVLVAALVGASGFAAALRLLPAAWLKSPIGDWLDRPGRSALERRIGARWRSESRSNCANGCCPTGNGCAVGRTPAVAQLPGRRIALRVLPVASDRANC